MKCLKQLIGMPAALLLAGGGAFGGEPPAVGIELSTADECLATPSGASDLNVDIILHSNGNSITGAQVQLAFDDATLDFDSVSMSGAYPTLLPTQQPEPGLLIVSAGIAPGGSAVTTDEVLITVTFTLDDPAAEFCFTDALVVLGQVETSGGLPIGQTEVTFNGSSVGFAALNDGELNAVGNDLTPPVITPPADVTLNADAGTCAAVLSLTSTDTFDTAVATAVDQAPGVWYDDRYPPAIFDMFQFEGENVLRHGVDEADFLPINNSTFYNTQGRKYDINMPTGSVLSADIYIAGDWDENVRRQGLWGVPFDASGEIAGFPILGFVSNDPDDSVNPDADPADLEPRFRAFVQDTDFDLSNGVAAGWIDLYDLEPGDFGQWFRFEIELTASSYEFRAIRLSDMAEVASLSDPITFGAVSYNTIILQQYNFGETYEGYWDNVALGPDGPVVTDNCGIATLAFTRSDGQTTLDAPFQAADSPVTITWTATDYCGYMSSTTSTVTVNDSNTLDIIVELDAFTGDGDGVERCITLTLVETGTGDIIEVDRTLVFDDNGIASDQLSIPCGDYQCIAARDTLHTLSSTDQDDFSIVGLNYAADFTSAFTSTAAFGEATLDVTYDATEIAATISGGAGSYKISLPESGDVFDLALTGSISLDFDGNGPLPAETLELDMPFIATSLTSPGAGGNVFTASVPAPSFEIDNMPVSGDGLLLNISIDADNTDASGAFGPAATATLSITSTNATGDATLAAIADLLDTLDGDGMISSETAMQVQAVIVSQSDTHDALRGGNLNDDIFIDILDFGVLVSQFGQSVGSDTPCGTAGPHADIDGDGDVGTSDFTFISTQFLALAEFLCDGATFPADSLSVGMTGPVARITTADLHAIGMGALANGDINLDGSLDANDIVAMSLGGRPLQFADINGDLQIDAADLNIILGAFGTAHPQADTNDDGTVDSADLNFLLERFGMTVNN